MRRTPNYSFEKPEGSDLLVPDPFNNNFDKIDTELYNLNEAISGGGGGGGGDSDPWELLTHGVYSTVTNGNVTYVDEEGETSTVNNWNQYVSSMTSIYSDSTKSILNYGLLFLLANIQLTVSNSSSDTQYYFGFNPVFTSDMNSGPTSYNTISSSQYMYMERFYPSSNKTFQLNFKIPMLKIDFIREPDDNTNSYRTITTIKSPLVKRPSRNIYAFPISALPNSASDDTEIPSSNTYLFRHFVPHIGIIGASSGDTTFGFEFKKQNKDYITYNGSIEYKLYGKHPSFMELSL